MAPVFSGSLASKKKSELQEIATSLHIADRGTKDELAQRIRSHLDENEDDLSERPKYAGLYGRRRRSIQPQSPSKTDPDVKPINRRARALATERMNPITESTPMKDLLDVSAYLKNPPITPFAPMLHESQFINPSSLPPLPPSPELSFLDRSIIDHLPPPPNVRSVMQTFRRHEEQLVQNSTDSLINLRIFLSNSRNIWTLTALIEFIWILYVYIPWQRNEILLWDHYSIALNYPPLSIFSDAALWLVLAHWFLPSMLIPAIFGTIISFHPMHMPALDTGSQSAAPFDPLTASIVRLAAQIAYSQLSVTKSVIFDPQFDVLGPQWRVLSASLGVAFAFAEAIAAAPRVIVRAFHSKLTDTATTLAHVPDIQSHDEGVDR